MGVEKIMLRRGNGVDVPKKHDEVSMEYTGWLYDDDAPDNKGKQFDSSVGRGDLITPIGVGRVILGWDEGILGSAKTSPMTLGEKATLTISPDYGYGENGFPGHIPANARLILYFVESYALWIFSFVVGLSSYVFHMIDVELKAINGKRA